MSRAPKRAIATILDLLKLILGLGHVATDNVENTKSHLFHRGLVHLFNWVCYGGIAVFNAMPLVGTALRLGHDYLSGTGYFAVVGLTAGVGVALWAFLKHLAKEHPTVLVTVFMRERLSQGLVWPATTSPANGYGP
ncbi:hypothetical protein [Marivita sp. XM-24bin2]|jgi:hypothetical protein|uniref:hypothetical protein n=1 Tax=unclassified Marivita TaxID=2632480 RepID=UPI0025C6CEE0|nr:hypothetical protein [Marivita sp. XM-24bin2]